MLKSMKLAVLGLVAIPLTFAVIAPVKAVESTTENEAVVTIDNNEILLAYPYRNYEWNDGYRDYRYRRNYDRYDEYQNDDRYRDYRHRRYNRYDDRYDRHPRYGEYREYQRYGRQRRCFNRVEFNGYGERYRVRVCQ